jgi:hypothetical protein
MMAFLYHKSFITLSSLPCYMSGHSDTHNVVASHTDLLGYITAKGISARSARSIVRIVRRTIVIQQPPAAASANSQAEQRGDRGPAAHCRPDRHALRAALADDRYEFPAGGARGGPRCLQQAMHLPAPPGTRRAVSFSPFRCALDATAGRL